MSGASRSVRGPVGLVVAAWLGGAAGCIQMPEPLELELSDAEVEDALVAASEAESSTVRERREARTHPLWPTPTDEPCPAVMFGSFEPQLDGGPMFDRVTARLATVADRRLNVTPSQLTLLRDHVDVPGLRLVAASDTSSGCTMGWSHTHCFVGKDDVYCPDGTTRDLERLVRAHGLQPGSLTSAGWLELAAVMVGAEYLVLEPRLVRQCTAIEGVQALAPAVELEPARVTVRFTAITQGHGFDHTVIVEADGDVTMQAEKRWHMPSDEYPWGPVAPAADAG